jgi:hypothetical protein
MVLESTPVWQGNSAAENEGSPDCEIYAMQYIFVTGGPGP